MALNAATDFTDLWLLKGVGSPVSSQVSGGRSLTLTGSGTAPRFLSSKRRRGAEFRSATFSATAPYAFLTSAASRSDLYASSKIKSFTVLQWVRPNRSGVATDALSVVGGIFSPGNMGATPWISNQPCLICMTGNSGRVVVSVMGAILDTTIATQSSGSASTAPLTDAGWNLVAVRVTGSTTVNNQVDAVSLVTISPTGQRRVYALGAHRAAAKITFNATNPSANDTFVAGSKTYTFKASLAGSKAAWTLVNGGGTNPAANDTVTLGTKVYKFTSQVAAAAKASAYIKILQTGSKTNGGFKLYVGGYTLTAIHSGSSSVAGDFQGLPSKDDYGARLNEVLFNPSFPASKDWKQPAAATSSASDPSYTAANASKSWIDRNFTTPSTDADVAYDSSTQKLTVRATSNGIAGNLIKIKTKDNPNAGGSHPVIAVGNASGQAADNTEIAFQGGLDAPVAYGVLIGANWAATKANLIKAVNDSGVAGTDYTADIDTDGPHTHVVASDPGGNSVLFTAIQEGSAGNSLAVSKSSTVLTVSQTSTGSDGADADHVKIGATAQLTWANLVSAINLTGAAGIDYGSPTVVNPDLTAVLGTGEILFTAKSSGAAGNGKAISATLTGPAAIVVRDEWYDKTATATGGGSDAPPFTAAAGSRPDGADLRQMVGGWNQAAANTAGIFYGAASDAALAKRVLTDPEVAEFAYTPPPVSTRDTGWYRAATRTKVSVKSDWMSAWTEPVDIPTGVTAARIPIVMHGTRHAIRVYGVEAGRPFGVSSLAFKRTNVGGMTGQRDSTFVFPYLAGGAQRNIPPPLVPHQVLYDLSNMTFQNGVARRRRGYQVLSADTSVTGYPSAIFDATTAAGDTYQMIYRGGTLYLYDNGTETSIDTGWDDDVIPTVASVGNKTLVLSANRQKVFIDGSVAAIGVVAPTNPPGYQGNSPSATANGVILAPPGYEYVSTNYDGTHNTDSGPSPSTIVSIGGTNPNLSPVKVSFTLEAGPAGTTVRKLWRRKVGTTTFFLVATSTGNTATEVIYDLYDVPSTGEILEVYNGVPVTAPAHAYTACGVHEGRAMLWGDPDDLTALAIGEVGDCERLYAFNVVRASGPIRAGLSHEGRWLIFTDRTVEVVEGDFVRGPLGLLGISRRILDSSKGVFGPFACTSARGRVFWCDQNGVHTLGQGLDQKDVTLTVSWPVHPIVAAAVDTSGTSVVMEFDYVSQQLWVAMTQAQTDSSTKNRIVLVLDLSGGMDNARWAPYDHSLSFIRRSNDGLLGQQFLGCGYNGEIVLLDVLDGDGCQGNESWFPGTVPVITAIDTATKTVTFVGTSLPTSGLRGVGAVFETLASTTNRFSAAQILSSTATTLTFDRLPTNLAIGDKVHVGGIRGFLQTAEVQGQTAGEKIMRQIEVGLIEANQGDF